MTLPHHLRRLLAGSLLGAALSAACFIEPVLPPAFRGSCEGSSDCGEDEDCISGLCQLPCTLDPTTFEDTCPDNGDYLACINGVCTSACNLDDPACEAPQTCVELDFGMGQVFGACAELCDEDDPSICAEDEVCMEGLCVGFGGGTGGDTDGGMP